jgi:hypothetical protein
MSINRTNDGQAESLDTLEAGTVVSGGGPSEVRSTEVGGGSELDITDVEPWPQEVNGALLLADIAKMLRRFVVLPKCAEEMLALWVLHTYAFELRDATTYIGIESPEKRCGKTTLLTVLNELVCRPVVASNISSSAFFRVIEEVRPTLLIDEADTFLQGNDELRGVLNAGYKRRTAFVVRVTSEVRWGRPQDNGTTGQHTGNDKVEVGRGRSRLVRFSCWCPKAVASIGKLPDTLADRCVVIRMQRKAGNEECERIRNLDTMDLRRQCMRFVKDNAVLIGSAQPEMPEGLNDRAADIWEPLFALADLAGESWPKVARDAAVALTSRASEMNPIGSLLMDIALAFVKSGMDRLPTRVLLEDLNSQSGRPWAEPKNGKPITDLWLAQQLRPYGIRPKYMRTEDQHVRGYMKEDFAETFQRYIPKAEARAYLEELKESSAATESVRTPNDFGVPNS